MEEKYRATQLWNNIIRTFRSQLPLKSHRKSFRTFERSFTGCEAIDWLHGYLCAKTSDPGKITRIQSQILLQKFHDFGLFCEVSRKDKVFDDCCIKDDSTIYRFNELPLAEVVRTPLALKTKSALINTLIPKKAVSAPYPKLPDLHESIAGFEDKENCFNWPSVESRYDEGQQIKSLEQIIGSDSQQPRKKFISQQACFSRSTKKIWTETSLLRLKKLLQLNSLDSMLDDSVVDENTVRFNCKSFTIRGVAKIKKSSDELPHWVLQAMKCLANWPWYNQALHLSYYENFEQDVFSSVLEFYNTHGCPLISEEFRELFISTLNRVEFLDAYEWDKSYGLHSVDEENDFVMCNDFNNNNNEDAAEDCDECNLSDLTEIVSEVCQQTYADDVFDAQAFSKGDMCPFARTRSVGHAHLTMAAALSARTRVSLASLTAFSSRPKTIEDALDSLPGLLKSPTLMNKIRATKCCSSATSCADALNPGTSCGHSVKIHKMTTSAVEKDMTPLSFFTKVGRKSAVDAMQICLLFLPPKNRRWLHLLLRLINKVAANFCLKLDKDKRHNLSNKALMIESFCDCLFMAKPLQTHRSQASKLLNFLVDNEQDVFKEPFELVQCVQQSLDAALLADKGRISIASSGSLTYCEQIPAKLFEPQGLDASHKALVELLDSIINYESISLHEKKRRLRKFEKAYPSLFAQRFPNKASFKNCMQRQSGSSKSKFVSLKRFRAMRL